MTMHSDLQIIFIEKRDVGSIRELNQLQEQLDQGWELVAVSPDLEQGLSGNLYWKGNQYYYRRPRA